MIKEGNMKIIAKIYSEGININRYNWQIFVKYVFTGELCSNLFIIIGNVAKMNNATSGCMKLFAITHEAPIIAVFKY